MRRLERVLPTAMVFLLCTAPLRAGEKSAVPVPKTVLSPAELEVWNDPEFQKQFAQSYLAETDIEPGVDEDERERMQKILELISGDKMDEAARMLEKQTSDASSAVFDFTLANIYFQQDKPEPAAAAYRSAVEKYPKFRRAWKNLALIYVQQGDYERAIPALTRVIELGGSDALTYGLLGFSYSSRENNLPAESAYRMAILLDPVTMDWKMGLARSLFKQERYAEAATLCGDLLARQPERVDLWLLQANAYIGLNQPMRAAENYEMVDRLGTATAESMNMLGDIYTNEELFDMAVASYSRAMERAPEQKPVRPLRAATVLISRGAFAQTKQLLAQIESVCGQTLNETDRKDMLKLRARIAVAEGAGGEEAAVLEKIVELDPLDGEALILLGQQCRRSGDTEKAVFYFERAEHIERFEADAKLRHAQLLVSAGKYDEAVPLLRRVQTIQPRDEVQKYLEQVEQIAKSK